MDKPAIPDDEEARLKALRSLNLLDTESEERFDRLTRMAKRLFDVPIALVSLVDENRQWFKSCIGLDVKETSRGVSFCGHAILGDDAYIIADASLDDRFADNPLVVGEPYIRFYAGYPLKFTDGSKLGTLCIIDTQPRNLDEEDIQALRDLASTVEREIAAIQLATLDELTNVLNRRGFMMLGQHSLNLCIRQHIPATLAYLDLNKFKQINDTYGHAEGDKMLVEFSEIISNECRDSDLLARLGGDEFVILFINSSKDVAIETIARLQKSLNEYNIKDTHEQDIEFAYGMVELDPDRHQAIEALLEDGDALMYEHKNNNR